MAGQPKFGYPAAMPATPRLPLALALAYFGGIFALGFALGTVRTLWLAPRLGEIVAVLTELPVMLAASLWWARRLLARRPLPRRADALAMGLLAFVLLMAAEAALAAAAFGQSPVQWLAGLLRPAGLAGLAGQMAFAAMPALVWRTGATAR